jgi:hypothetical protein
MTDRITIQYGEFYDFPRMVRFQFRAKWFYLESRFNEEKDDYPDFYEVYLLPFTSEEEFQSNPYYWMNLSKADHLGRISIKGVGLDETRRRSIDARAFETWLLERKKNQDG